MHSSGKESALHPPAQFPTLEKPPACLRVGSCRAQEGERGCQLEPQCSSQLPKGSCTAMAFGTHSLEYSHLHGLEATGQKRPEDNAPGVVYRKG